MAGKTAHRLSASRAVRSRPSRDDCLTSTSIRTHRERTKGTHVGSLVTLDLTDDSPELSLPWIITFGPEDDDEVWEPVVCGPYERAHALALAETVVADEQLTAIVEPVLPHATVDEIRTEIESNRAAAEGDEDDEADYCDGEDDDIQGSLDEDFDEDSDEDSDDDSDDFAAGDDSRYPEAEHNGGGYDEAEHVVEPTAPPSAEEIRAGFARIAARLTSAGV
jgi:hypothetical protein